MSRLRKGNEGLNYLVSLRAVVAAASVRFHVGFFAGWMDALFREADHASADLV